MFKLFNKFLYLNYLDYENHLLNIKEKIFN
jgi:hypothetical protein